MTPQILNFLTDLKNNNDRTWFAANKDTYDTTRKSFEEYVNYLISRVSDFDKEIAGLRAKDCVFRLFRDVRFSHNKEPYKNNFGAFLAKGGRNAGNAGYYLHIEPQSSFVACGIYMPPNDILKKVRTEIYENIDEFLEIINDKDFTLSFQQLEGEKLVKAPKGFPADFQHIDLLKFKSYGFSYALNDAQLLEPNFLELVIKLFEKMYPFNQFINRAIND